MRSSATALSACSMARWCRTRARDADPMRNFLTVLFRNLARERLYAAINIAGLALGIACCLILGLFLKSELTYDQHYKDHEHIYRAVNEFVTNGNGAKFAVTSEALGPMMAAEYPAAI